MMCRREFISCIRYIQALADNMRLTTTAAVVALLLTSLICKPGGYAAPTIDLVGNGGVDFDDNDDGVIKGSYTYVDPHGVHITVHYGIANDNGKPRYHILDVIRRRWQPKDWKLK